MVRSVRNYHHWMMTRGIERIVRPIIEPYRNCPERTHKKNYSILGDCDLDNRLFYSATIFLIYVLFEAQLSVCHTYLCGSDFDCSDTTSYVKTIMEPSTPIYANFNNVFHPLIYLLLPTCFFNNNNLFT